MLQGTSLVTMLTNLNGIAWTDTSGSGLSVSVLDTGKIQINGLALANTKYTFALKAIAVGPGGHVVESLAGKVSVKTANL